MLYFTSDTHFGHDKILTLCLRSNFFKTMEDFQDQFIKNWNETVPDSPDSEVWVLGDWSFTKSFPWCKDLHGTKYLIRGNHDKFTRNMYRKQGFEEVFDGPVQLPSHSITLSHYPYFDKRYPARAPKPPKFLNHPVKLLHGHLHGAKNKSLCPGLPQVDVGVDVNPSSRISYRPRSLKELYPC